jgi:tetratricopeptide (TPR) repeat protein
MLLALTTLAGGFTTPKHAHPYWSQATGDTLDNLHFSLLFHTLAPLYPGKQGLQAVRPDLLGEALVAQALLRPEAAGLLDAILANSASQLMRHHALTVFTRLSIQHHELHETLVEALVRHFAHCYQDIVAVATEAPSQLPVLAAEAFARLQLATKSQIASLLAPLLREESVQLAQFSCLVTEYLLGKCNQKCLRKPDNNECMKDYALAAARHSLALMRVGRDAEALKYGKQALELDQRLVQKNPDRHEPAYASDLNNYANRLSDLGQFDEALTYGRQALELYPRLIQRNPDRHEPAYAGALDNYANHLGELGQYDEALKYDKQALELYRRLIQKDKDRFEPAYAGALNNYANRLSDLGQFDEALTYGRQALELYQRLVEVNQDRHEPDYVGAVTNYAVRLGELGQHDEALKYSKQALDLRQRLAEKNPDRHEPEYGGALNNHAIRLGELGQYDEALKYGKETLELRQRLFQKDKDRFEPSYAGALSNYAHRLSDLGQYDEALAYAEEARELYQRPAQKHPARFAEDLFNIGCMVHFLSWISTNSGKEEELGDIVTVPTTIRPHRRPIALLNKAFVQACWASEHTARTNAFKQVISIWCDLPLTTKATDQATWLCAATWCATFEPSAVQELDWQDTWHQYANHRKGRLPSWMQGVAQRMLFEWPT